MRAYLSLALVLATTATVHAQGEPSAHGTAPAGSNPAAPAAGTTPANPAAPAAGTTAANPAAPADPAAPAAPATSPAQGLPAYPAAPHVYAPPPSPPADAGRATIDAGASLTGSDSGWLHGAWMLEAGYTIPKLVRTPYFVRARAALMLVGGTIQSDWSGMFTRYAVGAEAGVCGSLICGFVDLDVAYQHADLHDDSDRLVEDRKGPNIYSRLGIDIGPRRIHLRGALEFGRWKTHHSPSEWQKSGGLFLGLGIRL